MKAKLLVGLFSAPVVLTAGLAWYIAGPSTPAVTQPPVGHRDLSRITAPDEIAASEAISYGATATPGALPPTSGLHSPAPVVLGSAPNRIADSLGTGTGSSPSARYVPGPLYASLSPQAERTSAPAEALELPEGSRENGRVAARAPLADISEALKAAENGPPPKMPVAFAEPDASMHLNERQLAMLEAMRDQFTAAVGTDPADPKYAERWQEAQPVYDARLKDWIGFEAYDKLERSAIAQWFAQVNGAGK